jgi:hypothetical protein
MLSQENYITNAHRLSFYHVDDSVANVYSGQLFQLNDAGKWVYADGTKKAYPTLNDRFPGEGLGLQGERLEGLDNVSRVKKIACLKGNFEIGTDQYDKDATFVHGEPIVASLDSAKKGLVTPYVAATHEEYLIIGFVTHVPTDSEDMIRYEG